MNLLYWRFWLDRLALFSATSPTVGSARETDERWMQRFREKSEERNGQRGLERWWFEWK